MEIKRLNASHYDALIGLLNAVFSRKNGREMDFEKEIPKMCVRDDLHMGRHIGVFEEGRLVGAMGIYLFEAVVAGERLLFATTGNIAVHWDCEGRGYMDAMMAFAMEELEREGVDVARLGGLRSRYNRYGFESCGQNYTFTFTAKNRERKFPAFKSDIAFTAIEKGDVAALSFAASLYNKNAIAVPRTPSGAYLSMTTWQNKPYLATREGEPIGYLCVNAAGNVIAEQGALDACRLADLLCAWQERVGANIFFTLPPYATDAVRLFSAVCESSSIGAPSHFKILRWDRAVDAFMKLKATYCPLPRGELSLGIEGFGTLRLFVNEAGCGCESVEGEAELTLDPLAAARYLFGPYPPIATAEASPAAQAFLPLPLSWNGQDRV